MSMSIVLCFVLAVLSSTSLSQTPYPFSFLPQRLPPFLCVSLTPKFSLALSLSLLGECVLLGRADSSYLAEALWTIKI